MGKIKSRMVKRTGERLIDKDIGLSEDFERNKKIIGKQAPSKKLRNKIAGYISRLKRHQREKKERNA
ncbi:MAG TPA: 30S ribosomal protein S17e [Candidatus Nanoarchaeia archaeon]|nr:30S ribosomal protein S17e [Candidatus Nanoarchaeia archaeon]